MKKAILATAILATTTLSATVQAEEFSIKGLKMGMNAIQIAETTGADVNYVKTLGIIACTYAIDSKFTIGGRGGWSATCYSPGYNVVGDKDPTATKDGMYKLTKTFGSADFNNIVEVFSQQYGKAEITSQKSKNVIHGVFDNRTAVWNTDDVKITIYEHLSKYGEGYISISDKNHYIEWVAANEQKTKQAKADF